MSDEIIVRVGTPEDIDDVMRLAQAVAAENAPCAPNVEKILTLGIWPALHKQGGLIGVVGPRGGGVHGFVLLRIGTPWYSDESVIEENGVYVHPDHRGGGKAAPSAEDRANGARPGHAALLYRFCRRTADQLGMKLMIGVMSQHRQASKLRYYSRFFGPQAGAYFLYDPHAKADDAAA